MSGAFQDGIRHFNDDGHNDRSIPNPTAIVCGTGLEVPRPRNRFDLGGPYNDDNSRGRSKTGDELKQELFKKALSLVGEDRSWAAQKLRQEWEK